MAPSRGPELSNTVPSSSISGNSGGPSRQIYSCEQCRRRKVKCDGTLPCKNCTRRAEDCKWIRTPTSTAIRSFERSSRELSHKGGILTPETLEERVARIEEALSLAGLLPGGVTGSQPGMTSTTSHIRIASGSQESPPRTVAIAISDLVESANANQRPASEEVGIHDRFDHQIISAEADQDGDEEPRQTNEHSHVQKHSALVSSLPPRLQCDILVAAYFERLEWIHHTIHVPTFIDWYKAFWTKGIQSRLCLQRLALLFSILCLAIHFDLEVAPRFTAVSDDVKYHRASQEALVSSEYLAHHSIPVIQTLILQGIYLNNCGQAETHHANLALAIRMANGLGLSQLDAGRIRSKLGTPGPSSLHLEMGRRVYWSLVCQDCYTASSCNFTYNIPPSQIKTRVFADLRDDELETYNSSSGHRSPDEPTTSTYHIEKIAFALTARKAVDLFNEDGLTHDIVPELERENWSHYRSLPPYLRLDHPPWQPHSQVPNSPPSEDILGWGPGPSDLRPWDSLRILTRQLQWQRLFLGFTIHNRTMRLHRAYLARGYTDQRYRESKNATLQAAVSLLQLLEEAKRIGFPLQWWVVLIHVFTASVALCIDRHMRSVESMTHNATTSIEDDMEVEEEEENLRLIQVAIEVLSEASRKSRAAKRAVRIVETLLAQSQQSKDQTIIGEGRSTDSSSYGLLTTSAPTPARQQMFTWESALQGWLSATSDEGRDSTNFFGTLDGATLDDMPTPGYLSKELLDTINSFASSLS